MIAAKSNIAYVAQSLLAQREHSVWQLKKKLQKKGYQQLDIDNVLVELISQGLQSDSRYAELYVHQRLNKGYGPRYISQYLVQQGIATDVIEEALTKNKEDLQCIIQKVWQKKFGKVPLEPKQKAKQQQFLLYRGFNLTEIQIFFNQLMTQNQE